MSPLAAGVRGRAQRHEAVATASTLIRAIPLPQRGQRLQSARRVRPGGLSARATPRIPWNPRRPARDAAVIQRLSASVVLAGSSTTR